MKILGVTKKKSDPSQNGWQPRTTGRQDDNEKEDKENIMIYNKWWSE